MRLNDVIDYLTSKLDDVTGGMNFWSTCSDVRLLITFYDSISNSIQNFVLIFLCIRGRAGLRNLGARAKFVYSNVPFMSERY